MDRKRDILFISAIAAVALAVLGKQLATPAVFACLREDTAYYINWTRQFADALSCGVWYPRWMYESHGGYGNPTFVFYPPLVIYLTAAAKLATAKITLSISLVKLSALFFSGLTMYFFAKDIWGARAGLAAAVVYMALPFRVFDLYFLGVYASKFAYVWFPLILLFARRSVDEMKFGPGSAFLAVSYALLSITHLLSAYMFTPVLFGFALAHAGRERATRTAVRIAAATAAGLLLSAFYLLPVVLERGLVHFEALTSDPWLKYWNNYLYYIFVPVDENYHVFYSYMARVVLASVLMGAAAYLMSTPPRKANGRCDRQAAFFMAVVVATLFLMTSLSGFVWAFVPGMSMLQFPTRWAAVTVFGLACITGAGVGRMAGGELRRPRIAWVLVFALLTAHALYYDVEIITRGCAQSLEDIAAFPEDYDVYEYVPANVSLEWLKGREGTPPEPRVVSLGQADAVVNITRWGPQKRSFTVDSGSGADLSVRTFYYPGWRARVDAVEADIGIRPVTGAMIVSVPAGRHEVMLEFGDTPGRLAGRLISAAAVLTMLFILWRGLGRKGSASDGGRS